MIVWWGYGSDILRDNTSDNNILRDMEDTLVILGQLLLVASVIGGRLEEGGWPELMIKIKLI